MVTEIAEEDLSRNKEEDNSIIVDSNETANNSSQNSTSVSVEDKEIKPRETKDDKKIIVQDSKTEPSEEKEIKVEIKQVWDALMLNLVISNCVSVEMDFSVVPQGSSH